MRILHTVENYYPSVGGSQEVVRQLSERLVRLGHDVTVATTKLPARRFKSHNGVKVVEFDVHGKAVTGYTGKDEENYKKFLIESEFDIVMNYAAQQWATDLAFQVIDRISCPKVLVPCGFSGLYNAVYKGYFANLPDIMKKYDASIYLSDNYRDINFAREHKIKNTHLIPNGAGADEFTKIDSSLFRKYLGIPHNDFLILCVGSHTGLKGHREAMEIFDKANIRNSTLLIIGNDFGEGCAHACKDTSRSARYKLSYRFSRKKIQVRELRRDQTVAAYKEADLFLFPSNVEASPLVLFEAMASGTAYLTTDVGNSKEIIQWSNGGELLPTKIDDSGYSHADIAASTVLVEDLFNDPQRLKSLAEKGHSAWRKKFTWENITKQYEDLYESLAAK